MRAPFLPFRSPAFLAACRAAGAGAVAAVVLAGCSSVSLDEPPRRPPPMPPQQLPPPQPMPPQAMPVPPQAPPAREPQVAAFTTRLDGRNEVPPVYSMGTGTLDAVLDRSTGLFRFRLSFSNLSGPITAAHFHGPAEVGANAPPAVTLNGPYNVPYEGRLTLTPAQRADLLAGRWYINLHTAANPAGELRGQLIEQR